MVGSAPGPLWSLPVPLPPPNHPSLDSPSLPPARLPSSLSLHSFRRPLPPSLPPSAPLPPSESPFLSLTLPYSKSPACHPACPLAHPPAGSPSLPPFLLQQASPVLPPSFSPPCPPSITSLFFVVPLPVRTACHLLPLPNSFFFPPLSFPRSLPPYSAKPVSIIPLTLPRFPNCLPLSCIPSLSHVLHCFLLPRFPASASPLLSFQLSSRTVQQAPRSPASLLHAVGSAGFCLPS